MKSIPLVLIAGFLGAGKTTFLSQLTAELEKRGTPFSIVVNDFVDAEVDAVRLRTPGVEVQALSGSCVCCSSLNEFLQVLGDIEVPPGGVLLVEANGASDLISLITALAARGETQRFTSPLQVTMLDASRWQKREDHNELEREQMQTATHWMLTHLDHAEETRIGELRAWAIDQSPRALETDAEKLADTLKFLCLSSRFRRVAPDPKSMLEDRWQATADHHHHHENERAFTAMKVDIPFVVKRRDLEETLRELPEEVIRVKGLCRLAELPTIPMSFQHVRPQAETWFLPMLGNLGVIPTGVIIGVGLPVQDISRRFADLPSAEVNPGFKPYDL